MTWEPSISWFRSKRRPRLRAEYSASDAPDTTWAGPATELSFPKFRMDLLACAAATRAMRDGFVEAVRYPRNPLDVLAQQVVASVAMEPVTAAELFDLCRHAAPFAALSRESFESVLDLLSGRYPSDEFAGLRARITWDRTTNLLTPRESAGADCGRERRDDSRSRSLWRLSGRR